MALAAAGQLEQESRQLERQWALRVERARYEAERARRQYDAVEPENRLVARSLERAWEETLRLLVDRNASGVCEQIGPADNYSWSGGTIVPRAYWLPDTILFPLWRYDMKIFTAALAAAATTLLVTAASAAPLARGVSITPESNIQNVRMVCNEDGRCWRERGERHVIIRERSDAYGYAPRERYIERRHYDDGGGIGFRAPGVSVGIGTDRY